jgi:hypothetical protein
VQGVRSLALELSTNPEIKWRGPGIEQRAEALLSKSQALGAPIGRGLRQLSGD